MSYDRSVLVDEICARIAEGEPLRVICRDLHMPAWRTVYLWRAEDPGIDARIAQARVTGFDAIAEDALAIADTPMLGEEITNGPDGKTVKQGDMLGHRKLQIETRLKLLAKWDPKRYGDLQKVEHSGSVDVAAILASARSRVGPKGGGA